MAAPASWGGPTRPEFETLVELGQGGMAIAYLARALGVGGFERLVVLKRLNLELMANTEAVERFLAEARIAARIHHANVVGTQQVGRDNAGPFIVLDYVEGGALDELVNASSRTGLPLEPRVLLRVALDALAGLEAVHEATDASGRPLEILHRDLTLENVLVSVHDGVARISDFGVAQSVLSRVRTTPGYLVGKLLYLAPEYLQREPLSPRIDLYSLGVTLWLALSREKPWPGYGEGQILRAIIEEGLPPLPERADLPEELRAFVLRACARDPAARFQSAREMKAVLSGFDRERGWVASHAEVAACVSALLGPALKRRRRILAEHERDGRGDTLRAGPPAAPTDPTEPARHSPPIAVALPAAEPSPVEPSPSEPSPSEPPTGLPAATPRRPVTRRPVRARRALLALALALVASAALVFALTSRDEVAPPPLMVVAPVTRAPEPSRVIVPEAPDVLPVRPTPHERPPTQVSRRPPSARLPPAATPARPARDEIQKQNPYR